MNSLRSRLCRRLLHIGEYHRISDKTLGNILDKLEAAFAPSTAADADLASGVLTIRVEQLGTFVVNKQPPSQQIWLSSPVSGPQRFDYVDSLGWINKRGQNRLEQVLGSEIGGFLGIETGL